MATTFIEKRKFIIPFILYVYITSVRGTTTITTSCHGFVSETLNITCTIDPHNSGTSIVLPDGTDAAACSAPLPNTICNQIPPYTTDYTKVGTKITFVLTIPSLDIDIHNGTWTCKHGLETSTGDVCVNAPLSPQGKEPTFTAIHTSAKSISLSGEVYCQHPVSAVTFEVLYAEQNGAYTTFNPQPSVSIQNLGSNGCSSQESNVSFSGILSCDNYTLAGKTFTLMARFNQSNLPPDSNTYNITSSGSFSCPDAETTTITNVETTTTSQTTTELFTTSTEPQTSPKRETTDSVTSTTEAKTTRSYSETTTKPLTSNLPEGGQTTIKSTTTLEAESSSSSTNTVYTSTTKPSGSPLAGEEIIIITVCSVVGFIIILFIVIIVMFTMYKRRKTPIEKHHKQEHTNKFHKQQEKKDKPVKTFDDFHALENRNKYERENERHISYFKYSNKRKKTTSSYQHPRGYDHNKYNNRNTISTYYPRMYGESHNYGFDWETSPYEQNYQYYTGSTPGSSYYDQQKHQEKCLGGHHHRSLGGHHHGRSSERHHGRSGERHHGRYQRTHYQSYPAASYHYFPNDQY